MLVARDRRLRPERPNRQIRPDRDELQAPQHLGHVLLFRQSRAETTEPQGQVVDPVLEPRELLPIPARLRQLVLLPRQGRALLFQPFELRSEVVEPNDEEQGRGEGRHRPDLPVPGHPDETRSHDLHLREPAAHNAGSERRARSSKRTTSAEASASGRLSTISIGGAK